MVVYWNQLCIKDCIKAWFYLQFLECEHFQGVFSIFPWYEGLVFIFEGEKSRWHITSREISYSLVISY